MIMKQQKPDIVIRRTFGESYVQLISGGYDNIKPKLSTGEPIYGLCYWQGGDEDHVLTEPILSFYSPEEASDLIVMSMHVIDLDGSSKAIGPEVTGVLLEDWEKPGDYLSLQIFTTGRGPIHWDTT